ncbi:MAG: hypothetical protein FJ138_01850 [Deltaproteobacteria bacterium]|nr:hypothetical protein [Deltaproteobacteria bacterium]
MRYIVKFIKVLFGVTLLSLLGAVVYFLTLRAGLPTKGDAGEEADSFARMIQSKAQREAWAQTGAIKWTLWGREHLWDLRRGLVRVKQDDLTVLFDITRKREVARRGSKLLKGEEAAQVLTAAYESWLRDRFILEPTQSFFDKGVKRFLLNKGTPNESLFVHYSSQLNPALTDDSYEWLVNAEGTPRAVRVWSSAHPLLDGVAVTLERWKTLKTGLKVATRHELGPFAVELSVSADMSLTELMGDEDPFKEIEPDPFEPAPSSQPNVIPGVERPFY